MRVLTMIGTIVLVVVIGLLAYIRLAPSDPARWHQPVPYSENTDMQSGAARVIKAEPNALARIDAAARGLQRTSVLAGSVEEGRITYVTRSAVFGFPDYTTVEQNDKQLKLYARQRFGRSDFGVNRDRLEQLLAALEA
ncbi:DUF1499 domain-containing protein [Sulfitobacter sp. D35]|uniref:DUF1499 domain-containing protein n=1 Tax=Sulfitobacter sp. D35 TaxID=3083252 RepID=UPI00296FBA16|nr:DUF1499 domain-containing protein [Sulfitobacter sp. D35]MDW4497616.1 DUF1499 domain-containing protein [Sulfitobacter sp. D35]